MTTDTEQAARDAAYNNTEAVKDSVSRVADWENRSAAARARPGTILDLAYGPAPRNRIDYFPSERQNAPLFVFIHGGYWQRNSKETFSFIAGGPQAHGIAVAVTGYTLAPEASLTEIVGEVASALDYLCANADRLGFDPARIYVGGWSAGGHLAAVSAGHPRVRGVFSISGIFDLAPIAETYINDKVALDDTEISTLSPLTNIPPTDVSYRIHVGSLELPALQKQSAIFASALQQQEKPVEFVTLEGMNHFTIVEELADANGALAQGLARLVGETD